MRFEAQGTCKIWCTPHRPWCSNVHEYHDKCTRTGLLTQVIQGFQVLHAASPDVTTRLESGMRISLSNLQVVLREKYAHRKLHSHLSLDLDLRLCPSCPCGASWCRVRYGDGIRSGEMQLVLRTQYAALSNATRGTATVLRF